MNLWLSKCALKQIKRFKYKESSSAMSIEQLAECCMERRGRGQGRRV
jgi:hypothetical protein